MYAKYTTECFVLGTRDKSEADKMITLYTKEFGLVFARASGARKETSRMRYALTTSSRAKASLIKGKTGWRVAGAVAIESALSPERLGSYARVSNLLSRLIHGEEEQGGLYEILDAFHNALRTQQEVALHTIELIAVVRILHVLGYLSAEAISEVLLMGAITDEVVGEAREKRTVLLGAVNTALSASQL